MTSPVLVLLLIGVVQCAYTVVSCPKQCHCSRDHLFIDCRGRHLTELPDGIPVLVQTLLLDDNYIKLSDGLFEKFKILQSLSLRENRIKRLPNNIFNGLYNLKFLDLSHNDLDYIENLELQHKSLSRVLALDMSFNRQMELPIKLVENLRSLRSLNVSYNQITSIRLSQAFKNTRNLLSIDFTGNKLLWLRASPFHMALNWNDQASYGGLNLNLSDCNIMSIGDDTFSDFHTINELTLSGNRIIEENELHKVVKSLENSRVQKLGMARMGLNDLNILKNVNLLYLTRIDVSNNTISDVRNVFKGTSRIEYLYMNDNRVRSLDGMEVLTDLKSLLANKNHLVSLETRVEANLTNLFRLELRHNQISRLNSSFLANAISLTYLDLSDNRITNLEALTNLKNLRELRITHNRISDINALKSLHKLTHVDLTFNHIKTISKYTFSSDYQMDVLNMSRNLIESIDRHSFASHSPRIVDLSHNRLKILRNFGFTTTERIHLRNNYITKIEEDSFEHANSLILLDLAENRISSLNSSINSISTIQYLDLTANPMQMYLNTIGQSELSNLRRLNVLGLRSTGLKRVQVKLLQSLPRLRQLDLSKNQLIALHPSLLIRQLQLQFLNLSNNRLESVSRKSFEKLPHLQLLDVSNNPLHCTCELLRFIRWTFKNNVTIMNMDREKLYRCVWPQAWTDLPMAELHFHMDNCLDEGDKVIVYIAVGFLVALAGLALILTCYFIKCCVKPDQSKRRESYDELDGEDNETSWV